MVNHTGAQNAAMFTNNSWKVIFYMKFCPRCGSKNLEWVLPHDRQKWECRDCGYVGAFIIEDGEIADEIKKEYLKNKDNIQES